METLSSPDRPAAHKRRQIADTLRKMVDGLQEGDRLPSVTDLEKHFGVAKRTVESALTELQQSGLIVRRQGAGTFVAARVLSSRPRSGRIMITSLPLGNNSLDIFSVMASALAEAMRRLGYDPLLHFEMAPEVRFAQVQQRWEAGELDGYVHIGSAEGVTFPPVPGVILGEVPEAAPVHQVVVDNYAAGRKMGEYLWSLGHRRVAFIALKSLVPAPVRLHGLRDVFADHGASPEAITFLPLTGWTNATRATILEESVRPLLCSPTPPTALFFANDHIALPSLQTLLSWGLRVPEDITVVSFDDTPGLASLSCPALTGVRMPTDALGALAVQTLHQAITEPGLPFRRLRLPAELIVRESSGPPPETT